MILYAHPTSGTVPEFLRGANNLCMRRVREYYVYGVGPAACLGEPPFDASDIGDGWVSWVNEDGAEPESLLRTVGWCRSVDSEDQDGHLWAVPLLLNADGSRAFQATYSEEGLPVLSQEKQRLLTFAQEARAVLFNHYQEGTLSELPMQAAFKWAAAFLEVTNHVNTKVLGRLGLMNEKLILDVLFQATSMEFASNG